MPMNKQWPKGIDYLRAVKGYTWTVYSGCKHREMGICKIEDCWARRYVHRQRNNPKSPYSKFGFEPHFYPERLAEPLKLKKPTVIAVGFMGDLFGDCVPIGWIERILDVCAHAHWHRFLLLTKNPSRYAEFVIPDNCWCGTSVTGQGSGIESEEYKRIDKLLELDFKRRFVSIEPFTGDTLLTNALAADWVIVGGLSGKGARIANESLMWALVELCHEWNKPLFIKDNAGYHEVIQQYPEGLKL